MSTKRVKKVCNQAPRIKTDAELVVTDQYRAHKPASVKRRPLAYARSADAAVETRFSICESQLSEPGLPGRASLIGSVKTGLKFCSSTRARHGRSPAAEESLQKPCASSTSCMTVTTPETDDLQPASDHRPKPRVDGRAPARFRHLFAQRAEPDDAPASRQRWRAASMFARRKHQFRQRQMADRDRRRRFHRRFSGRR